MSNNVEIVTSSLAAAISDTMENMTFEQVEIISSDTVVASIRGEKLWSSLPIIEPYSGEICIELPRKYGELIAKEVYGENSENLSEDAILDLVAELLNTIAGRFLNRVVSSEKVFEFGLPIAGGGDLPDPAEKVTSILMNVGGYHIVTTIFGADFAKIENQ